MELIKRERWFELSSAHLVLRVPIRTLSLLVVVSPMSHDIAWDFKAHVADPAAGAGGIRDVERIQHMPLKIGLAREQAPAQLAGDVLLAALVECEMPSKIPHSDASIAHRALGISVSQ